MAKFEARHTDEFIWEWYQRFEHMKEIGMGQPEYCKKNNISLTLCRAMSWKIIFRSRSGNSYKKLMELAKAYNPEEMTKVEYAQLHKISKCQLNETMAHIRALEAIERMKNKLASESNEMKFIAVNPTGTWSNKAPAPKLPHLPYQEPEVVPKQNDVELIISKGVKVVVAPEVGADKLIRIIELLKDL